MTFVSDTSAHHLNQSKNRYPNIVPCKYTSFWTELSLSPLSRYACGRRDLGEVCSHLVTTLQNRDRGKSVMRGGGGIFIYSNSVSLISFEIDCFTVCERVYEYTPTAQLPIFRGPCKTCCNCPHSNRFPPCISLISFCSLLRGQ